MHLERSIIAHYGPFKELELDLRDESGAARLVTVIHGEGGTGKSTIIDAMAHTRPGKAVPLSPHRRHELENSYALCDWRLGLEDPDRPHPLQVCSPNLQVAGQESMMRRREQTYFDRCAAQGPGFVFVEIPSQRYFSRSSLGLNDPGRMMARYDVRGSAAVGDIGRPDLTRPCKQALSYAAIGTALAAQSGSDSFGGIRALGRSMDAAVRSLVALGGHRYRGPDPRTFEPVFESQGGTRLGFDELPNQLRHAIAFVALPIQMTWAGHGGADPALTECVVAIDDFELYLGPRLLDGLLDVLQRALPRAQWILTTGSPHAAAMVDADALVRLRRAPLSDESMVYSGDLALTH